MVVHFTFGSVVHFEFLFLNDIKSVSRFSYFFGHPIFLMLLAEKKNCTFAIKLPLLSGKD